MAVSGMEQKPDHESAFALNQASWDEMTRVHLGSDLYNLNGFLTGASSLHDFESEELGTVEGCSLLHLQCHFGLDTLSWARQGAKVTGLDFSHAAVNAAREIAERAALPATFVQGNVYDAPTLIDERFDVIYTGIGALNWLPDLDRWAEVVVAMLKPGGRFYIVEIHPLLSMLSDDDMTFDPKWTYFHDPEGIVTDDDRDYADSSISLSNSTVHEWSHHLGEVVSSLLSRGLTLQWLHEHEVLAYQPWPFLEPIREGARHFRVPEGMPKIPLEYSLLATKPEGR